jgi:hypothetical protein
MMVLLLSETTHWFHNVLKLRKVPSLQKDFAQAQQGVCPGRSGTCLDDEGRGQETRPAD